MTKPIHIDQPDDPTNKSKEKELETTLDQYRKAYKELQEKEYINSLSNNQVFRVELLNAINNVSIMFGRFLEKLEEAKN